MHLDDVGVVQPAQDGDLSQTALRIRRALNRQKRWKSTTKANENWNSKAVAAPSSCKHAIEHHERLT
jgi:hypothetical protein